MIKITTDSTCDLPSSLLERYKIPVFPLGVVKGGRLFRDGENIHTADIAAHVDAGGGFAYHQRSQCRRLRRRFP